jgi:predicted O-methyltransferase YrrM
MSPRRLRLDERLADYVLASTPPEHPELRKLRDLTKTLPRSFMQILPEQGQLLAFLVRLVGARRVLEIGTFTGYSAMSMALALPADGTVVTCDADAHCVALGRPYWARAGVATKIEVVIGPALATLDRLTRQSAGGFDLVFIDADKPAYDRYYECALGLVRLGGLIVLDNMLQRGEVADPNNGDPRSVAVRALNAKIAADERVDRVILAIADGMTLVHRRH